MLPLSYGACSPAPEVSWKNCRNLMLVMVLVIWRSWPLFTSVSRSTSPLGLAPAATESRVLNTHAAGGSGSRSGARQCESALVV